MLKHLTIRERAALCETPQERALLTADAIEVSSTYDQRSWCDPVCGTPRCVAGHLVYLFGNFSSALQYERYSVGESFHVQAVNILGLDHRGLEGALMFRGYPTNAEGETIEPSRYDAARMLRHWAKTGEIVWERL